MTDSMTAPETLWIDHDPDEPASPICISAWAVKPSTLKNPVEYIRSDLAAPKAVNAEVVTKLRDIANAFSCGDWTAIDLEDNEVSHKIAKACREAIVVLAKVE